MISAACRIARSVGAKGVLALSFPLHPPGKPEKSRMPELDAVEVATLVVQGETDPFGRPEPAHHREIVLLQGDHSLKQSVGDVGRAVGEWLNRVLRPLD